MKLTLANGELNHLSYCSNIHPGESWQQVSDNLHQFLPGMRSKLKLEGEFGIGLRLSALAARELAQAEAMEEFKAFLAANRLYVFTINGFPYGPFHGTRVKEDVYLPDWQDVERLRYTNELADVFAQFLPDGQTGSISTVPGAFKARVTDEQCVWRMTQNMVEHVVHLARLEQRSGKRIVLALEPEPCCFLETIDGSVAFFSNYLYSPASRAQLSEALGVGEDAADQLLRTHLTLCLDLCHAAVEFEHYDNCIATLRSAGVSIGKLQISAGLQLENVSRDTIALLQPFDDQVYLHQVVERQAGVLTRFTDLSEAFASLEDDGALDAETTREWRVHFHVPIFLDDLGQFSSTQFFVRQALEKHKTDPVTEHLEVETYTWSVLPERFRKQGMDAAIVRELQWVRDQLS
ncbi:metabolite traffic protein EboE [Granulosicoccus sp.]|nr:metabolite traffic protein EboE [Granulosicoccus sp.]